MSSLIECVPNISEGRSAEVIDEIADALSAVPGALLLGTSRDADHNRTVFTLAGRPDGLKQAIQTLYRLAIKHIDLRAHIGEHPRMGAVDVVPFIPLRNATLADCDLLAREVAALVADEFAVPTYLYAHSAQHDNRRILAGIRRGGFEGLVEKMRRPEWQPDFGPSAPHPSAGISAVGARFFLIAYNLLLDTPDVAVAQEIAQAVRESSGGLPYVQAMGVFLAERGLAQVSMNLLNYEQTPLHRVQERVKSEAARRGAQIVGAEIVGHIPQAALNSAAAHYLQIEEWEPRLVLENALIEAEERRGE